MHWLPIALVGVVISTVVATRVGYRYGHILCSFIGSILGQPWPFSGMDSRLPDADGSTELIVTWEQNAKDLKDGEHPDTNPYPRETGA